MGIVLIAVNETKGSKTAITKFIDILSWCKPKTVVLLYVEKYAASFMMDEMLGEGELTTLKEALEGSEYQQALDEKAKKVLNYYKKLLEDNGITNIKTLTKIGHPAVEILKTVKEETVDMIVVGSRGKRFEPLMMGSVSREVANNAHIPVLIVK